MMYDNMDKLISEWENKINYLITYHNLLGHKQLADRLIRTFSSEEYGFGRNIYVFRIGKGL